jgi:DNA-binding transcriptional MerR regulator
MPYKDKPVEKLYYTIGEVSEELDVNVSLVRFWAGKFPDFIKPARNKKGNRLFTAKDMANFKVIYYLVKEQGMTLEGAAKRMKDNITGEDKRVEVISRLTAIKEKLMGIADELGKKDRTADEGI